MIVKLVTIDEDSGTSVRITEYYTDDINKRIDLLNM